MTIPYLRHEQWSSWTRNERFFCSVFYHHARANLDSFANWFIDKTNLEIPSQYSWDIGYEVCFCRDYQWQLGGESAARVGLPRSRTYDLCLFGDSVLVIIEAKVCDRFSSKQNGWFKDDKGHLRKMLGAECPDICVVALASSRYLNKARGSTIDWFDGRISWRELADYFDNDLLRQADLMYKMEPGQFFSQKTDEEMVRPAQKARPADAAPPMESIG